MQADPFWSENNIGKGPFPAWNGPVGVKVRLDWPDHYFLGSHKPTLHHTQADGGGNMRGCGRIGPMKIHRAVNNRDLTLISSLVAEDKNAVNEVEATGMTPLHFAAWSGFEEGVNLLLSLGAKIDATSNSGESSWHLAKLMGHEGICKNLESKGARKELGQVLVPDNVNKVKDFYKKECWRGHPLPYADFVDFKRKEHAEIEARNKKAFS